MTFVPSAMEFPHQVYLLRHDDGLYVGITSSIEKRIKQHKQTKKNVELLHHFEVPTRREAEGVEAFFHQLQRQAQDITAFFCREYFLLHSLWFHRDHKGYGKHLRQQPRIKF